MSSTPKIYQKKLPKSLPKIPECTKYYQNVPNWDKIGTKSAPNVPNLTKTNHISNSFL